MKSSIISQLLASVALSCYAMMPCLCGLAKRGVTIPRIQSEATQHVSVGVSSSLSSIICSQKLIHNVTTIINSVRWIPHPNIATALLRSESARTSAEILPKLESAATIWTPPRLLSFRDVLSVYSHWNKQQTNNKKHKQQQKNIQQKQKQKRNTWNYDRTGRCVSWRPFNDSIAIE